MTMTSKGDMLEGFTRMQRIREFEERAVQLFKDGELPGFIHPSSGQEAVAVGITLHANRDDYLTSTHRGHGHLLAKGADMAGMMAELYGKRTGLCKGRGGSMHILDPAVGVLGANGIVGGGIPIATGAALASQMEGTGRTAICFFGDGAVNIGAFHESLNLAGVWRLPIVYVCENNQYAESTPFTSSLPTETLEPRAASYGMPGVVVDGNDLEACLVAGKDALDRARNGDGPTLIQANTYRHYGHHTGDTGPYRTPEEVAYWKARDPIEHVWSVLINDHAVPEIELAGIRDRARLEVDAAVDFARASELPDASEVMRYVYREASDVNA